MNKRSSLVQGIGWNAWSGILAMVVQFGLLALLARYVGAESIGALMLAWVVIRLVQPFLELGISNAIIQADQLNDGALSYLWRLQMIIGIVLFSLIWLPGTWLWNMFHGNEMAWQAVQIMSFALWISPISLVHLAMMRKSLAFETLGKIQSVAYISEACIGVLLLVQGHGIFALVYAYVTRYVILTLLILFQKKSWALNIREITYPQEQIRFAAYDFAGYWINQLTNQIDRILVGQFLGLQALAWYGMAWDMIIGPCAKIGGVINATLYPFLSDENQGSSQFGQLYRWGFLNTLFLCFPFLVLTFSFSLEMVDLIYGAGWNQVATLMPWMVILAATKVIAYSGGPIFLARGEPRFLFQWNVVWLVSMGAALLFFLWQEGTLYGMVRILALLSSGFTLIWWWQLSLRISNKWQVVLDGIKRAVGYFILPMLLILALGNIIPNLHWITLALFYLGTVCSILWSQERSTIFARRVENIK